MNNTPQNIRYLLHDLNTEFYDPKLYINKYLIFLVSKRKNIKTLITNIK